MPLYLAASHFGAKQLQQTSEHYLGMELESAQKHAQWNEVPAPVREAANTRHGLLLAKKESMRRARLVLKNMQCLLSPAVSAHQPDL